MRPMENDLRFNDIKVSFAYELNPERNSGWGREGSRLNFPNVSLNWGIFVKPFQASMCGVMVDSPDVKGFGRSGPATPDMGCVSGARSHPFRESQAVS
jgi:hypothetical protein